jgi:hypothetical protein
MFIIGIGGIATQGRKNVFSIFSQHCDLWRFDSQVAWNKSDCIRQPNRHPCIAQTPPTVRVQRAMLAHRHSKGYDIISEYATLEKFCPLKKEGKPVKF